jgi:multicomponent Na+:H+ antiporter subunit E
MNALGFYLINILLAILWMMLWGAFDIYFLVFGFVLSYLLLGLISRTIEGQSYGTKGWKLLSFSIYFIRILVKANLQVAWEIITPGYKMNPRFVRYAVKGMTPLQITSLANAITLTPGTLSVDASDDDRYLYVHCMYARKPQDALRELDELRERMMREVFG